MRDKKDKKEKNSWDWILGKLCRDWHAYVVLVSGKKFYGKISVSKGKVLIGKKEIETEKIKYCKPIKI